jgi:addiction module RelE/StbE family toxin
MFGMIREVIASPAFKRRLKAWLKSDPHTRKALAEAMELLSLDAFCPTLHSHKLRGDMKGAWACSVGYDLRIIFELQRLNGLEVVVLVDLGTHDDVY